MAIRNLAAKTPVVLGNILEVQGKGFVSYNGKTLGLTKGEMLYTGSEVVVDIHSTTSLVVGDDLRLHLGNASGLKLNGKNIEMMNGEIWFQIPKTNQEKVIVTANSMVKTFGGEFILIYDSKKAKSQLVVVNGVMNFSNVRSPNEAIGVSEGNFSYIDNTENLGAPRNPTPVGVESFQKMVANFKNFSLAKKVSAKTLTNDHTPKHTLDTSDQVEKSKSVELSQSEKDMLDAYRELALYGEFDQQASIKKSHQKKSAKSSGRTIASMTQSKKKSKVEIKVFGKPQEETMLFAEDIFQNELHYRLPINFREPRTFEVPQNISRGISSLPNSLSNSLPGNENGGLGDIIPLENHREETKKLIQELQNID